MQMVHFDALKLRFEVGSVQRLYCVMKITTAFTVVNFLWYGLFPRHFLWFQVQYLGFLVRCHQQLVEMFVTVFSGESMIRQNHFCGCCCTANVQTKLMKPEKFQADVKQKLERTAAHQK